MTTGIAENERAARIRRAGSAPLSGGGSAPGRPVLPPGPGRILSPKELDRAMTVARHERSRAMWNLASVAKNGIARLYRWLVRRRQLLRTLDALRRMPPHLRADIGVWPGDLRRIGDVEQILERDRKACGACG